MPSQRVGRRRLGWADRPAFGFRNLRMLIALDASGNKGKEKNKNKNKTKPKNKTKQNKKFGTAFI